jgi:hypothetical protein
VDALLIGAQSGENHLSVGARTRARLRRWLVTKEPLLPLALSGRKPFRSLPRHKDGLALDAPPAAARAQLRTVGRPPGFTCGSHCSPTKTCWSWVRRFSCHKNIMFGHFFLEKPTKLVVQGFF